MKNILKKVDKFNTVAIIINNNPEPFEGFTEIIDARDVFISKKNRISELLSILNKPYTEVYGVKTDSRDKLRSALKLAIGTGITIATRQQNTPLLTALKSYKTALKDINTHNLPETANRVYTELEQYQTIAAGAGLTAEKMNELKELTSNFRTIIEGTDYEFNIRKTYRKELYKLISECTGLLRDQLDPFVGHCRDNFPAFYNAYMTMRERKKYSRKKSAANSALADISGIVTDSVSGLPIPNVTINLLDHETNVTTDNDGYYLIDELEAGSCSVSCFIPGYTVPLPVTDELAAGESLVIDFSLVPVATPAAA